MQTGSGPQEEKTLRNCLPPAIVGICFRAGGHLFARRRTIALPASSASASLAIVASALFERARAAGLDVRLALPRKTWESA